MGSMKKIIGLLFLPLLLSSCSPVLSEYSIYSINNYDTKSASTSVNVSASQIVNLVKSKQSFPLYIYSSTCSYCAKAEKVINQYIESQGVLIYSFEYTREGYQRLIDNCPEIFPTSITTPSLYLIKEGVLTYAFERDNMLTYSSFKSIAKAHLAQSNLSTFSTIDGMNTFFEHNDECLIFLMNEYNVDSLNIFQRIITPHVNSKNDKAFAIIDKYLFETATFSSFCEKVSLPTDSENIAMIYSKNAQTKTTTYLLDDGSELSNWLSQYLSQ